MKRYLRIGEIAELSHISTQTLRLYAKYKLFEPEYRDDRTGYRYYTLEQCASLDLIKALKSCKMSLKEINHLFSLEANDEIAEIIEQQVDTLDSTIYDLSVSRNNLRRIQRNLQALKSMPPFGTPFFEYMDERLIDVQETPYDFFAQGYRGYKRMMRYMQNYMFDHQLPPSYFINVNTLIHQEDFANNIFKSNLAYIYADELYPDRDRLRTLPQGLYISIVSNHVELEKDYARILREEIDRQKMKINGDYLCEVLSPFPFKNTGELYFKIQTPVIRADTGEE